MVGNGYYGNGVLSLGAWNLGAIFLVIPNLVIREIFLKTFFFNLGLKGSMKKCVDCFLAYLFLGGFFIKRCKKSGVCAIALKNAFSPLF